MDTVAETGARARAKRKTAKLNVFISYSRQDMAFVDRLQQALAAHDIEAFVDRAHIEKGEEWWARIKQLVTEADTIVFVLSPGSVDSKICHDEVAFAEKLNKRFVPIVARDLEGRSVPAALARLNYTFFIPNPTGGTDGAFEGAIQDLIRALETDIAWIREHTRLGALAERWEGRKRPRDLLLLGVELRAAEIWLTTRPEKAPDPTDAHRAFVTESRHAVTRRQLWFAGLSLTAAVVALGLAGAAFLQRQEAVRQTEIAQSREQQAVSAQEAERTAREAEQSQRQLAEANEARANIERDQALIAQSRFLAERARGEAARGDAGTAVLLALAGLPDENSKRPRPLVSEAQVALAQASDALAEKFVGGGHDNSLSQVSLSADGSLLMSVDLNKTVFWDMSAGREASHFDKGGRALRAISLSRTGRLAIAVSLVGAAAVLDPRTGVILFEIDLDDAKINDAQINGTDTLIALGMSDNTIRIWSVASKSQVMLLSGHTKAVNSVSFDRAGEFVLSSAQDDTVRVWELKSKSEYEKWAVKAPAKAEWNSYGTAIATLDADRHVTLWSPYRDVPLAKLDEKLSIWDIQFDEQKDLLLTIESAALEVWEGQTGKSVLTYRTPGNMAKINAARLSPDGNSLAVAYSYVTPDAQDLNDGAIRLLAVNGGQTIRELRGHACSVTTLDYSGDGVLASGSCDGTARVWNPLRSNANALVVLNDERIFSADFSIDGSQIATSSHSGVPKLWDARTGSLVAKLEGYAVRLSRDSTHALTVGDGKLFIWDARTGALQRTIETSGKIATAKFGNRSRTVATSYQDSTIAQIWDIRSGALVATLEGHQQPVRAIAFSDDDKFVATGSDDRTARVWLVEEGKEVGLLSGHGGSVTRVQFDRRAIKLLTVSWDNVVRLWDIASAKALLELKAPANVGHEMDLGIQAVLSPDDSLIAATWWWDKTVRVWDATTGTETAVAAGHKGPVTGVEFSADSNHLLSISFDRTARLWSRSGKQEMVLEGHGQEVLTGHFSSNGCCIVTASADGTARVWKFTSDVRDLVERAHAIVPRCLTRQQLTSAFLQEVAPDWCLKLGKWPYQKVN